MEGLDHGFGMSGGTQAPALWAELARAARMTPDTRGESIARALDGGSAALGARVLGGIMELVGVEPAANQLVQQVDEALRAMRPELLTAVLRQLEVNERRRFAQNACATLSCGALVPLVLAAAPTYNHTISMPFRELVEKLAGQAAELPEAFRPKADAAFRSLVLHVFERWSETQVAAGSGGYDALFQPETKARVQGRVSPGPARVLELALETGSIGQIVWSALREQTDSEAGMRDLLNMVKRAPETRARDTIAQQLSTPPRLTGLLTEEPVDWEAADTLIRYLEANAIRPLLDQLVESNSRATRRALMDRLVKFGPEIQPLVLERVNDQRWYVVRNMITLLREAGCSLEKVPLEQFAAHPDPRVRRETLQLRLENPELRERALVEALEDQDKQVLRAALQAARSHLPDAAVTTLARRVIEPTFPAEFRVMSLYLLGRSGYPTALDTLLQIAHGGRSLFGKTRLAPKSPEMLAALSGLARSWSNDRRVRELLELAAKSDDPQVQNALHAVGSGEDR